MSSQAVATVEVPAERLVKRRIPRRIAEVVDLLVTGQCTTQRAAAERTGMNEQYISTALRKPEIRVFIERRARETIAAGLMRASARLNELVDADSEHVSLDATKHLLGIGGIKPAAEAQVSVSVHLRAGYTIDLRDDPPVRTIEHAAADDCRNEQDQ